MRVITGIIHITDGAPKMSRLRVTAGVLAGYPTVSAKEEKQITGGAVPKDFMEGVGNTNSPRSPSMP